jgi:hypothetical protein
MSGIIASKTPYYIVYILLFTVGLIYVSKFTQVEAQYVVKLEDLKESVIVSRVVKCLSEESRFGVMDEAKFDAKTLRGCFGDVERGFKVQLVKKEASGGTSLMIETGNIDKLTGVKRYVLVETNKGLRAARLELGYNKNEI